MKLRILLILSMLVLLMACGQANQNSGAGQGQGQGAGQGQGNGAGQGQGNGAGQGQGNGAGQRQGMMDSGMMERHHAPIPDEYADASNPMAGDEESIARGEEIYTTHCATCHGDGGMGDGPAGATEPPAAPIAHTSQMLGDPYLFWRVSEGGMMEPFNSTMIAYKDILDEEARWDVINYMQALGSGAVMPRQGMGGQAYDRAEIEKMQAEMLATAVEQEVITQEEADIFTKVHAPMEDLRISGEVERTGDMESMQAEMLTRLIEDEIITEEEAEIFKDVHTRLGEAELIPAGN